MRDVKAGTRLGCAACSTEIVVVRPPSGLEELTCSGRALVDLTDERGGEGHPGQEGGSVVGKRYVDDVTKLEVLCSKSGPGHVEYGGRRLTVKMAKPLPSSD